MSAVRKHGESSNALTRDERARRILESGGVRRDGEHFFVTSETYTGKGKPPEYKIYRELKSQKVCCTCLDFEYEHTKQADFRCKHILAVKLFLVEEQRRRPPAEAACKKKGVAHLAVCGDTSPAKKEGSDADEGEQDTVRQSQTAARLIAPQENGRVVEFGSHFFGNLLKKLGMLIKADAVIRREGWMLTGGGEEEAIETTRWKTIVAVLNEYSPTWSHRVTNVSQVGKLVIITVSIVIEGVSREGVGTGLVFSECSLRRAEEEAFASAAAKFGLYAHDAPREPTNGPKVSDGC